MIEHPLKRGAVADRDRDSKRPHADLHVVGQLKRFVEAPTRERRRKRVTVAADNRVSDRTIPDPDCVGAEPRDFLPPHGVIVVRVRSIP